MGGWVDGWMGGWVDGWVGGDAWMDGWVDVVGEEREGMRKVRAKPWGLFAKLLLPPL
jgi:hypothetical protein